jgi:hypothetical protein
MLVFASCRKDYLVRPQARIARTGEGDGAPRHGSLGRRLWLDTRPKRQTFPKVDEIPSNRGKSPGELDYAGCALWLMRCAKFGTIG